MISYANSMSQNSPTLTPSIPPPTRTQALPKGIGFYYCPNCFHEHPSCPHKGRCLYCPPSPTPPRVQSPQTLMDITPSYLHKSSNTLSPGSPYSSSPGSPSSSPTTPDSPLQDRIPNSRRTPTPTSSHRLKWMCAVCQVPLHLTGRSSHVKSRAHRDREASLSMIVIEDQLHSLRSMIQKQAIQFSQNNILNPFSSRSISPPRTPSPVSLPPSSPSPPLSSSPHSMYNSPSLNPPSSKTSLGLTPPPMHSTQNPPNLSQMPFSSVHHPGIVFEGYGGLVSYPLYSMYPMQGMNVPLFGGVANTTTMQNSNSNDLNTTTTSTSRGLSLSENPNLGNGITLASFNETGLNENNQKNSFNNDSQPQKPQNLYSLNTPNGNIQLTPQDQQQIQMWLDSHRPTHSLRYNTGLHSSGSEGRSESPSMQASNVPTTSQFYPLEVPEKMSSPVIKREFSPSPYVPYTPPPSPFRGLNDVPQTQFQSSLSAFQKLDPRKSSTRMSDMNIGPLQRTSMGSGSISPPLTTPSAFPPPQNISHPNSPFFIHNTFHPLMVNSNQPSPPASTRVTPPPSPPIQSDSGVGPMRRNTLGSIADAPPFYSAPLSKGRYSFPLYSSLHPIVDPINESAPTSRRHSDSLQPLYNPTLEEANVDRGGPSFMTQNNMYSPSQHLSDQASVQMLVDQTNRQRL